MIYIFWSKKLDIANGLLVEKVKKSFLVEKEVLAVSYIGQHTRICYFLQADILAAMNENMISGFPARSYLNKPAQLQRLARKFACSRFRYTFQLANNKGADQTAQVQHVQAGWCLCCSQTPGDRVSCVEANIVQGKRSKFWSGSSSTSILVYASSPGLPEPLC